MYNRLLLLLLGASTGISTLQAMEISHQNNSIKLNRPALTIDLNLVNNSDKPLKIKRSVSETRFKRAFPDLVSSSSSISALKKNFNQEYIINSGESLLLQGVEVWNKIEALKQRFGFSLPFYSIPDSKFMEAFDKAATNYLRRNKLHDFYARLPMLPAELLEPLRKYTEKNSVSYHLLTDCIKSGTRFQFEQRDLSSVRDIVTISITPNHGLDYGFTWTVGNVTSKPSYEGRIPHFMKFMHAYCNNS